MCGEQDILRHKFRNHLGSPPRVRGTARLAHIQRDRAGITPACAGNRRKFNAPIAENGDHPRVCGEQVSSYPAHRDRLGSPPRVRGTAKRGLPHKAHGGITPACAGNRCKITRYKHIPPDHPRVCGEQTSWGTGGNTLPGSPPRVRGTAWDELSDYTWNRITPACAGNR